jgi:DNA-binding response OmpR family regulator
MIDAIASQPPFHDSTMQTDGAPRANNVSAQHRKKRKSCLLLVGSQNAFKSAGVVRVFGEHKFELVARSSTLVEALACLTPGAIELVVTSNEFSEEELELFAIEARRRRYDGLILHPVDKRPQMATSKPQEIFLIKAGDLVVDTSSHRVWIRGMEIRCSSREYELLRFFSKHPEEPLSHESLMEVVWGDPIGQRHSLRELIRSVRSKIELTQPPRYIVTQRQFGYRFVPSPATSS